MDIDAIIVLVLFISIFTTFLVKAYFHLHLIKILKQIDIHILELLLNPFSNIFIKFEVFLPIFIRQNPKNIKAQKYYNYSKWLTILFWILVFLTAIFIGYVNRGKSAYEIV